VAYTLKKNLKIQRPCQSGYCGEINKKVKCLEADAIIIPEDDSISIVSSQ